MARHTKSRKGLRLAIAGVALAIVAASGVGYFVHRTNESEPLPSPAEPAQTLIAPAPTTTNNPVTPTTKRRETSPPTSSPTRKRTTTATTSNAAAQSELAARCTNQIDYASDPRDNATINSIGERTGHCPKPIKSTKLSSPDPWVQGQIDWCKAGGDLPAVQPKDC